MKIALIPFNPVIGDVKHNFERMLGFIENAINQGCEMIIFPELSLIGYPPKDYLFYKSLLEQQNKCLTTLKRRSKKITIITGGYAANKGQGRPFKNQAFIFQNGQQHTYTKQLLPNYDVFDECRYFEPGHEPLVLRIGGKKFGITLCEDIWFKDQKIKSIYHSNPLDKYKKLKPDFIINISASPFELDKIERRQKILIDVTNQMKCPVIYVNQLGGNDDLVFDGTCAVYKSTGQLAFQTPLFEEQLNIYNTTTPPPRTKQRGKNPSELLEKALVTGTRDYVHKTGFTSVALGLSGGIDSTLVAYIAAKALGPENVLGVMMPSRFSSKGSVVDSQKLAKNIGIQTQKIEINAIHKAYEKIFNQVFKKDVKEITAENIQARIRGNLLMAISNNSNRLILNTSNKSEMAMGYSTLYGDMCGALAVIADLTKTQIYALCRFINRDEEIIPADIINKEPSAELKPNQKDSNTLPPYKTLDPLLEDFIDRFIIRHEALDKKFTTTQIMKASLRNEYKRYQSPPVLKVTGKAFGAGRRIPLAARLDVG